MPKDKQRKSVGYYIPGIEGYQTKYEEIEQAIKDLKGYRDTLNNLNKPVPRYVEICINILSEANPLYSRFRPRGG